MVKRSKKRGIGDKAEIGQGLMMTGWD